MGHERRSRRRSSEEGWKGRKRGERVKGWRGKKGGTARERERGVQGLLLPSLSPLFHDFLATSRSNVALHRASSSFNEEFGLLLVSPLVRPHHRFYAIRRRSRVLLHPRSRIFLTIHRANPPRHRATVEGSSLLPA